MVAISWVGFDRPSSLGRVEYGGFAALPLWTAFMEHALAGTPDEWIDGSNGDNASSTSTRSSSANTEVPSVDAPPEATTTTPTPQAAAEDIF
jgi:penicillin-binding protein 1A